MTKIYQVSTYLEITDPEKLSRYAALAAPAIRAAGGEFLARGTPVAVKEQGQMTRVVIIRWPSLEVAKTAFASETYQQALAELDGGATRDIRYIEAV